MPAQFGMPTQMPNSHSWTQPTLRLKIPDYDGDLDVEEWLLRVNHYFNYYNVQEWDRIKVFSVQLKRTDA